MVPRRAQAVPVRVRVVHAVREGKEPSGRGSAGVRGWARRGTIGEQRPGDADAGSCEIADAVCVGTREEFSGEAREEPTEALPEIAQVR